VKVEAFIFDIGNVLVTFDQKRIQAALVSGGADEQTLEAVRKLAVPYERGEISGERFLGCWRDFWSPEGGREELTRIWQEIFEPNPPMWDLVEKLHGAYPLYLLSNTNGLHHEYLEREYALFQKFADGVFSYRAKMLKPERGIFELAIRQFGVRPEATVYLDDLTANVEAAEAAGLRAFLYRPDAHAECLAVLRAQGVQCV
jgi:haloacid dehalogenase superfamily, subfamily IA, variant 3 with third motif having DD or ED